MLDFSSTPVFFIFVFIGGLGVYMYYYYIEQDAPVHRVKPDIVERMDRSKAIETKPYNADGEAVNSCSNCGTLNREKFNICRNCLHPVEGEKGPILSA